MLSHDAFECSLMVTGGALRMLVLEAGVVEDAGGVFFLSIGDSEIYAF